MTWIKIDKKGFGEKIESGLVLTMVDSITMAVKSRMNHEFGRLFKTDPVLMLSLPPLPQTHSSKVMYGGIIVFLPVTE